MRLVLTCAASLASTMVLACGGIGRGEVPPRFAGQTDIVIWDAERKIEHFIRDARFEAKGDLGFLAPTPNVPQLASVAPEAFTVLASLLPQDGELGGGGFGGGSGAQGSGGAHAVNVVKVQKVGAYSAAVLRADDPGALREWLQANDFPAPEWLESWVEPYLDKGWPITAFKLREGANASTGPIRMSFRTNTPFAPYAVPKENGGTGSTLRLFLISAKELEGAAGRELWNVPERGRAALPDAKRAELARHLKLVPNATPAGATVSEFRDTSFGKEPKEDLFFIQSSKLPDTEPRQKGGGLLLGSLAGVLSLTALAGCRVRRG